MGEFHLDIVKLYKADLYGSRGQTSYMNDELPQIINTYTSDQAMNALREIIGYGYDKRYIGEVLERVKEFYYDFPNIPMRTLESRVKDFIRSKY